MTTGATPQINVQNLRQNLQKSSTARLKTRRDGKTRYIMVNAPVTLYNLQGNPNPTSNRPIQFNSDGTIDFGPFSTGFRVLEVGTAEVVLGSEHKLIVSTVTQRAIVGRGVYDEVMQMAWKLGWNFG